MARMMAVLLGLLMVGTLPISGTAQGAVGREAEVAGVVRAILAESRDPHQVVRELSRHGLRLLGHQESRVTFLYDGSQVVPLRSTSRLMDGPSGSVVRMTGRSGQPAPMAGEKADLTLTLWLYEWRNRDGTYSEQAVISGNWSATEYWWLDDPADVVDVRWIAGDLVYVSSMPFDGVQRDQHTNGIASFTAGDQVQSWDLFVNFRPVSTSLHGKWTNIFANYTHTWFGVKLAVILGAAPQGATGTISVSTDGKTWTEGTGLAFQIGSGATRGPAVTGAGVSPRFD